MERSEAYHIIEQLCDDYGFTIAEREALKMAMNDIEFVDFMPEYVVPVVRCRDCKWWDDSHCTNTNGAFCVVENGDWFCASGERKGDDA